MADSGRFRLFLAMTAVAVAPLLARGDEPPAEDAQRVRGGETRFVPMLGPVRIEHTPYGAVLSPVVPPPRVGKYWIGVGCEPAGETLRAQLGVEQGLVVTQLSEGQAADKAGIQKHDLLLEFGDKKLSQVQDLIDAIDAVEGKETTLLLMRSGKEIKIDVTPIERPKSARQAIEQYNQALERVLPPNIDAEALKKKLQSGDDTARAWDRAFQLWDPASGLRMWRLGPGLIGGSPIDGLPDGVTVTVTKWKNKPAQIIVRQGEQGWNLTEETLDKLPDDLREPVKRFLGQAPTAALPRPPATGIPPAVEAKPPAPPRAQLRLRDLRLDEGMQQQMDEMLKQLKGIREQMERDGALDRMRRELDSLRREVDQLREKRGGKE